MNKYTNLVIDCLKEIGEESSNENLLNAGAKTKIFGPQGNLDSMGIVFLITEIEERISDEFDIDIVLADERAMSQVTSPFRNVETLSKYIDDLINL